MALQAFVGLGSFFNFLIITQSLGLLERGISPLPVARPLPTRRTTQEQKQCTQTSVLLVGFESTILEF
jgi:hypothetical protein